MTVAIVHDYLTQRGGAERVVLSMLGAFPQAPVYTTLYEPARTFPEFEAERIRPSVLNRLRPLRSNHRLAFPLLAPAVSRIHVEADVVVCSSSGWAHGVAASGEKVVYCHAPARWLYQSGAYLRNLGRGARLAARALHKPLVRWDKQAARTAARYVVNSSYVADSVRNLYGIDAEVLPPPPALSRAGPESPVSDQEPGFLLCVSRLLPYKNVDIVIRAFQGLPAQRLVVVGEGPDRARLEGMAGTNVRFVGSVDDATLRWLYTHAAGLVAASIEDYGLTPLEASLFGKPAAVLRFGGFLDTLVEGTTGVFIDHLEPRAVAAAIESLLTRRWEPERLAAHAARCSEEHFVSRLREIVADAGGGDAYK